MQLATLPLAKVPSTARKDTITMAVFLAIFVLTLKTILIFIGRRISFFGEELQAQAVFLTIDPAANLDLSIFFGFYSSSVWFASFVDKSGVGMFIIPISNFEINDISAEIVNTKDSLKCALVILALVSIYFIEILCVPLFCA